MSSREILEEARRIRPELKVILTSAYSKENIAASFAGLGVERFIRKPFQFNELVGALQDTLSDYATQNDPCDPSINSEIGTYSLNRPQLYQHPLNAKAQVCLRDSGLIGKIFCHAAVASEYWAHAFRARSSDKSNRIDSARAHSQPPRGREPDGPS